MCQCTSQRIEFGRVMGRDRKLKILSWRLKHEDFNAASESPLTTFQFAISNSAAADES